MWIRAAYFDGKLLDDCKAEFIAAMENVIMPSIRSCPGLRKASVWWPRQYEDRSEDIFCQIIAEFDSEEGIAEMLGSPERRETREKLKQLLPMFEGVISHINFEVP